MKFILSKWLLTTAPGDQVEGRGRSPSPACCPPLGADVQGVPVSVMGSVKAGFTHVAISLQLEGEVMSSGQLALICAAALCEKNMERGWSQNSKFGRVCFSFVFGSADAQWAAEFHKFIIHFHTCEDTRVFFFFSLPVSPLCSFVFSDNNYGLVADDKGNCRIPSESVLYFDRERAEPSEKRETCHFWAACLRGGCCFDMCLCEARRGKWAPVWEKGLKLCYGA